MLQDDSTLRDPEFPGAWVLFLPGTIYWQPPCYQDIYGLVDPRTNLVRYIGRSRNAQLRLREHLRPGNRKGPNASEGKQAWLDEVAGLGLEPTIDILERVEPVEPADGYYAKIQESITHLSDDRGELIGARKYDREMNRHQIYVNEREQRWILYGVQNSWPLTNGGSQIREDGIFTAAFVDVLRQQHTLDILHEPLESPPWRVLVPTCPQTVQLRRWMERREAALEAELERRRQMAEAEEQEKRSKRRKAHQAAGQSTRPRRRDDHQAPVP